MAGTGAPIPDLAVFLTMTHHKYADYEKGCTKSNYIMQMDWKACEMMF